MNTNSSIRKINKENFPLQRRRKIVWFFIWIFLLFGWLAFVVWVFSPRTMITSRQPAQEQTFNKSLAKQQQWLNFRCSTLRSGLLCPIRNKAGVMEPTPRMPGFPELPSLKIQLRQSLPPLSLHPGSSQHCVPQLRWMSHCSCPSFSSSDVYLSTALFMQRYQGWTCPELWYPTSLYSPSRNPALLTTECAAAGHLRREHRAHTPTLPTAITFLDSMPPSSHPVRNDC